MLSEEQLAELARSSHERASAWVAAESFPAVVSKLVEDRSVRARHRTAVRLLKRLATVDVTPAKNRKGELARALGLQVNTERLVLHRAIALAFERLREHSEYDASRQCLDACSAPGHQSRCPHSDSRPGRNCINAFVFPYHSKRKAAETVVRAFYCAGLDRDLTAENVDKIVQRVDLGGPFGHFRS